VICTQPEAPRSSIDASIEKRLRSVEKGNRCAQKHIREISDNDLVSELQLAMCGERSMTIKVLHRLNEMSRRRLYLKLGYSSLFDYCTRHLKYSASAAHAHRVAGTISSHSVRGA